MKTVRPGIIVFTVIGLIIAGSLTYLTDWAEPHVAYNQEKKAKALIAKMLPSDQTNLTLQPFTLLAPNYLHMGDVQTATRVFSGNTPIQVIYRALSDKAYHDKISILSSFDAACTVMHVEIISQKETPGLGDQFKNDNFAWLRTLAGKTTQTTWALKPHGDIDTWTGATVTPAAITKTLSRMQQLCQDGKTSLFSKEEIIYLELGHAT